MIEAPALVIETTAAPIDLIETRSESTASVFDFDHDEIDFPPHRIESIWFFVDSITFSIESILCVSKSLLLGGDSFSGAGRFFLLRSHSPSCLGQSLLPPTNSLLFTGRSILSRGKSLL